MMDRNLALLMVAFWQGVSLAFFVVTLIRYIHRLQAKKGDIEFSRIVPLYVRILMFGFVAIGIFGYAGLVANFVEQREQTALLLLLGVGAGAWAAYRLDSRAQHL